MNKMIGFLGSYATGLAPSSTPACGVARSALVAVAEAAVSVDTTVESSVVVVVAIVVYTHTTPPLASVVALLYGDSENPHRRGPEAGKPAG